MAGCEDMDSLSLSLLRSMDDLVKSKVEMEKYMSEGFILMAKSRMILGKERVSMMQFPSNDELMAARYCVHSESSSEEILPLEKRFETSLKFDSNDTDGIGKSDSDMQLRRRKGDTNQDAAGDTEAARTSLAEEEQTKLVLVKKADTEPLKWFGVLVPQELKMAQKAFEKSVSLSVDCANIQNRIEKIKETLAAMKASDKGA